MSFFADLQGICTFFSTSSQRTALLDETVKKRLPCSVLTRWNFNSRSVNTLFEYKKEIIQCLKVILDREEITNSQTISLASGHIKTLNSSSFTFWLSFFHKIMPHVDTLFAQLERRDIDAALARSLLIPLTNRLTKLEMTTYPMKQFQKSRIKQSKTDRSELKRKNKEVCGTIIFQINETFDITGHSVALVVSKGIL